MADLDPNSLHPLVQQDSAYIWHPYTQMKGATSPIPVVRGQGAYLFDAKGKRYIDAISSWWVNIHGHGHPYIAEQIAVQARQLEHCLFAGFTHPKAVELARRVLAFLPSSQKKVFFSDNGSTAVEVAIKMALQYWRNQGIRRNKLIAFRNAYHGDTFGAMSVGSRSVFTLAFEEYLFDVEFIEPPVPGSEETALTQLTRLAETGEIAAFIFEPLVQGAGGMVMHHGAALSKLLDMCKKYHIICIADEVMTGFGRTGTMFATDQVLVKPDIYCVSKGLTGGFLPLGLTTCTSDICDAFASDDFGKTFFHGHSYTGNPLSCAAACANLDLFEKDNTLQAVEGIGQQHKQFADSIAGHPSLADIRLTGTILALEFHTPDTSGYTNTFRQHILDYFLPKGIIVRPLGNVLYLMPPYCVSEEDLTIIYSEISKFLDR